MFRADMNEVDIQPVDLGDELGMSVQVRLAPPPVVIGRPIPRQRLNEGELHALRKVRDGFLLRESCRRDAPAQFVEFRVCSLEAKRTNRGLVGLLLAGAFGHSGWCHADLLLEHMKPDTRLPIYQTKVSTIPSSHSPATLTLGIGFVRSPTRFSNWAGDESSQVVSTVDTLLPIDTKV